MNNEILSIFHGGSKEYLSIDTIIDDENGCLQNSIPIEFVNSISPNGLRPHKLILEINVIIILSRNLNLTYDLCNGTRLIVWSLGEYEIKADIIYGNKAGITAGLFLPSPTKNMVYEEICITSNYLFVCLLLLILINN